MVEGRIMVSEHTMQMLALGSFAKRDEHTDQLNCLAAELAGSEPGVSAEEAAPAAPGNGCVMLCLALHRDRGGVCSDHEPPAAVQALRRGARVETCRDGRAFWRLPLPFSSGASASTFHGNPYKRCPAKCGHSAGFRCVSCNCDI